MAMEVKGSKVFSTSPNETYRLLTDPDVIARTMPGIKSMKARAHHVYDTEIEIGVPGMKGTYQGVVQIKNAEPGRGYTLDMNGEGPLGYMHAEVEVKLRGVAGGGTALTYEGEATIGGKVAGVGKRVLSGVGKLLMSQFFNGVAKMTKK